MSMLSPGAWFGRIAFLTDNLKKRFKDGSFQLDIKLLNKILMAAVIVLTVYFFTSLYTSIVSLTKFPALKTSVQEAKRQDLSAASVSVLKNTISYYTEKVKQRDIFKIGKVAAPKEEQAPKEATPKIIEETQHFKLVGISWSNDPDAMIEDTVALRTLFVKRGDMVGRVKVQAIFRDKVVLSFEGEETELK